MAQVAVCESVGADLEPNDDGMHFRNGADERMMDEVVHRKTGDEKRKGDIDAVGPSNNKPCRSKVLCGLRAARGFLRMPLGATKGAFGLIRGDHLNYVRDEKVAGNQQVENQPEKYVLATVVVAAYTNEDSVLYMISGLHRLKHETRTSDLHEILNDQS